MLSLSGYKTEKAAAGPPFKEPELAQNVVDRAVILGPQALGMGAKIRLKHTRTTIL